MLKYWSVCLLLVGIYLASYTAVTLNLVTTQNASLVETLTSDITELSLSTSSDNEADTNAKCRIFWSNYVTQISKIIIILSLGAAAMLLCRKSMTILCTSRNSTLLAYGFSEIDPSMTICNRVLHENLLLLFQCALTLNSLVHRRMREISPICYSAQMLLASCGSFLKLLVMTLRFHTQCCVQNVIGSDVDQTVLLHRSILHLVLRHLNVCNCVKSSTYSRVIQYSTK